jgi:hypothetical protein
VNTDSETHIDERIMPMSNAPRVSCTGTDAGMADKGQERVDSNKKDNK